MEARRFCRGRYAHQSLDPQTIFPRHPFKESWQFGRCDTRLLRLVARIDLNQQTGRPPRRRNGLAQRGCQAVTIEGLDDIEKLDRLVCLIALQWADQAQFKIGMGGAAASPMFDRLLDPVFPEYALPRSERCIEQDAGLTL